jgi:branched-chain amino acid transport system ATP-binding protein
MTAALELEAVSAGYGRITVVRDVFLEAPMGQITCLLGRNGAGKTTLLRAIMGLLPRTGTVRVAGQDTRGWPGSRVNHAGVAWVPQEDGVIPGLTIAEHFTIASRFTSGVPADEILDWFPVLGERMHQVAHTLSGGERKMLGIAVAMTTRPRLVLLDEPTEGVAPVVVAKLVEVIRAISQQAAVLLVEQNLDTAIATAQRAYVLEQGTVVETGDIQALHASGVLEARLAV